MAVLNLPVVGGDDNTWGEKVNAALNAINNELAGVSSTLTEPVNFYRRYVSGAWQLRGSDFPTHPRVWVKDDSTVPDPPVDGLYFLAGTDILLRAT